MDALSALFTLLVAAGSVASALYAKGYVDRYLDRKPAAHISLHYFAFTLLSLSMTAVVTASGGYTFLFWWELMTLSSFVLILFDAERKEVLKAALTYLVMMHLGFFALLIGFVVLQAAEGSADFGALAGYFAAHRPLPLLLVFLAGFGMKAGLFPMHVWLPEAHPAAPSHVSALMSGVMIKTGVYGVLRTAMYLPAGETLATAGVILLGAGIVTGLWGVLLAAMQNDIKRLLAYSSIENVGIIFIAIGVAPARTQRRQRRGGPVRHGRRTATHPQPLVLQIAALLRRRQPLRRSAYHRTRPLRRRGAPDARHGDPLPGRHGGDLRTASSERVRLGIYYLHRHVPQHRRRAAKCCWRQPASRRSP